MLWGGSYAVKMDQLQDDFTKLKSFLVRDILLEDQYILISRAERIRSGQPQRIRAFLDWLRAMGLRITRDPKMVTDEALEKQTALLLAARDRLAELDDENIRGVSIKCQHEIYSEYGVNACMLPAFLPFPENELGPQRVYPTVCEGDTKGLLTGMLLHAVNPAVPPAFGDLVSVGDDHVEFANCGAGSLFWARNSLQGPPGLPRRGGGRQHPRELGGGLQLLRRRGAAADRGPPYPHRRRLLPAAGRRPGAGRPPLPGPAAGRQGTPAPGRHLGQGGGGPGGQGRELRQGDRRQPPARHAGGRDRGAARPPAGCGASARCGWTATRTCCASTTRCAGKESP